MESHCKLKDHYDAFMTVVNGKKHKAFEKIQANKATAKADHGETALLKRPKSNSNNDEDEDDQDEDADVENGAG